MFSYLFFTYKSIILYKFIILFLFYYMFFCTVYRCQRLIFVWKYDFVIVKLQSINMHTYKEKSFCGIRENVKIVEMFKSINLEKSYRNAKVLPTSFSVIYSN